MTTCSRSIRIEFDRNEHLDYCPWIVWDDSTGDMLAAFATEDGAKTFMASL